MISSLITGTAIAVFSIWINRKEKRDEHRASTQQQENVLIMKDLQGIGHLAEATALGHKNQQFNGNIDAALDYYHKARDEMNDFLLQQNAEANH
jgi:hypothetical protein